MTGKELIEALSYETGYRRDEVKEIFLKTIELIQRKLKRGEKVRIIGLGTFEVKERKAREGRNPRTGEVIQLPANKLPIFKAGKSLKSLIRKK